MSKLPVERRKYLLKHIDYVNFMNNLSPLEPAATYHVFCEMHRSNCISSFYLCTRIKNIAIETLEQHGTI